MATIHEPTTSGGVSVGGTATARIERSLEMTPEAGDFLTDLARRTGLREGDVIRLALGPFKTAVDAREQGEHIGIASTPDGLDIEIVGFLRAEE